MTDTTNNAEAVETPQAEPETPAEVGAPNDPNPDPSSAQPDAETFPRTYVEELRRESAKYRQRAQQADDLAQRLHGALVAATGRLADASDLAYDEAHLTDPAALDAAITALLAKKPHLASRTPRGDVGQGATGGDAAVDLAGILRAGAR